MKSCSALAEVMYIIQIHSSCILSVKRMPRLEDEGSAGALETQERHHSGSYDLPGRKSNNQRCQQSVVLSQSRVRIVDE